MVAAKTWTFSTSSTSAPACNAGPDQDVAFGATVTLDGRASHDPEGQAPTYSWQLLAGPELPGGDLLTGWSPTF